MKSRLLVLTLTIFIFSSCESSNPKESNHNNFDFEKVDSFGKPLGWQIGFSEQFAKGYLTTQDSVIKHSGKFSIKLHFVEKTPSLGICYMVIPSKYKGSKIKLTGYIKTESVTGGYAGLYLKLNGEDGLMGRDMMERTGLRGTNDWQKVSISLPFQAAWRLLVLAWCYRGKGFAGQMICLWKLMAMILLTHHQRIWQRKVYVMIHQNLRLVPKTFKVNH